MLGSVKYVANKGALKKIATSDGVAYGGLQPAAQNGARTAAAASGERFNVKVYTRNPFRARAVILPVAVSIRTEQKIRALMRARPRL